MTLIETKALALAILNEEVKPALGCTEPVAVALAAAKAAEVLEQLVPRTSWQMDTLRITAKVNPNLFKNGVAVGIPNCSERGIHVAAALGTLACHSELGLRVFEEMNEEAVEKAIKLASSGNVDIDILDTSEKVRVELTLELASHKVLVILSGRHDRIAEIWVNDHKEWENQDTGSAQCLDKSAFYRLKVREIIHLVEQFDVSEIEFLKTGLEMNRRVAKAGLENPLGMAVGYRTVEAIQQGLLGDDIINRAFYMTSAGSDARMSGLNLPVMSSNGSGNNGLTAILPLVAWFDTHEVSDEDQLRSMALSHLLNCYIKDRIGRLSAMCSCSVSAATGSGAAISWLMNKDVTMVEATIKNMAGNLTGLICDGGKEGCSLKLGTGAATGVRSAILASMQVVVPSTNGIVDESVEKTIENMGIISAEGMQITDRVILDVMIKKMKS